MNVLVYHHNDMDGWSAAAVVKHAYGDNVNFKFVEVDYARTIVEITPEYDPKNFDAVVVVDLSLNADTIPQFKSVAQSSKQFTWIDHHKTSIELSAGDPELEGLPGIRSINYCGAYLAFLYYNLDIADMSKFTDDLKEKVPGWIRYVDDWDTWKHLLPETNFFRYGFESSDHDPDNDEFFGKLFSNPDYYRVLIRDGEAISKYVLKQNERYLKCLAYETTFEGHRVLVMNRRENSLLFLNRIKEYDFVVAWEFNGEVYKYSLYSDKNIDLTEIAKKYGGGGHPQACGFSSEEKLV